MPKRMTAAQVDRHAKARRASAMTRNELRMPSSPRAAAAGPTAMAVKITDPADRARIDAALAKRRT